MRDNFKKYGYPFVKSGTLTLQLPQFQNFQVTKFTSKNLN